MGSTVHKLVCKKGHRANAVIWEDQSIDEYIRARRCNSCCAEIERV